MANLIIKSSADNLVLQGSGGNSAITVAAAGTTTFAAAATFTGALTAATIDTGNGATEIYDMDQDIKTDDIPSFPRVTNTAAPCFMVSGGSQGNFAVSNNSYVVLTDVDINTGGGYSTSTGKYTVPVAGRYLFSLMLYMYTDDTQAWKLRNGSSNIGGWYGNAAHITGTDNCATLTQIETCAVGNEIGFYNDVGGTRNLYGSSKNHTRFMGQFLG